MPPIDVEKGLLDEMATRKAEGKSIADLLISARNTKFPEKFREAAKSMEQKMNRILDLEGHDPGDRFQVDGSIQKRALNEDALIKRVQTLVGCVQQEGAVGPETIVKVNQYLEQHDLRDRVTDLNQKNTKLAETCAPLTTKVAELEERLATLSIPPVPVTPTIVLPSVPAVPAPPPQPSRPSDPELSQMKRKLDNFIAVTKPPKEGWDTYLREQGEPSHVMKRIDSLTKSVARIEAFSDAITAGKEKPSKRELSEKLSEVRRYVRFLGDKNNDGTLDSPNTWQRVIHGLLTRGSTSLEQALKKEPGVSEPALAERSPLHETWRERVEGRSVTRFLTWPLRIFR